MIKVVFVGDSPSNTNVHPEIAFIGAKCFNTLVEWIKQLPIDYYICFNSNDADLSLKLDALTNEGFKVIALGNKASDRLTGWKIGHYKLPHPSGLNRKLNDKRWVALELFFCCTYLVGIDGQD